MELRMTNVTKTFRDVNAVEHVSKTLESGVYGLLGVNGAGKTTLMRMLCTLIRPTGGTITWDGNDIFALGGEYRKMLGYLPQDFGFYPDFTVQDYLYYIAAIKGLRPTTARQRTDRLLEQVGLSKERNQKMKKLSGGMKRRVGIAQAMLNDPRILILDEPTAGLDPGERIRFRNLLSELAQDRIVLLSTHIVSDVEYIANEILLMKDGRIVLSGTSEELTAALLESVWICTAPSEQVGAYLQNYKVANVKTLQGNAQLRIVSPEPPAKDAAADIPTLEDVFLYYFGEKAGEEDVSL